MPMQETVSVCGGGGGGGSDLDCGNLDSVCVCITPSPTPKLCMECMGLLLSDLECLFSVTNRAVVYVCMYLVCYPPPPPPPRLILSAVCKHLELT